MHVKLRFFDTVPEASIEDPDRGWGYLLVIVELRTQRCTRRRTSGWFIRTSIRCMHILYMSEVVSMIHVFWQWKVESQSRIFP